MLSQSAENTEANGGGVSLKSSLSVLSMASQRETLDLSTAKGWMNVD